MEVLFSYLLPSLAFAFPALITVACWACSNRLKLSLRILIALLGAVFFSPLVWGAVVIFLNEGGGIDPDPSVFLMIVLAIHLGVSAVGMGLLMRMQRNT